MSKSEKAMQRVTAELLSKLGALKGKKKAKKKRKGKSPPSKNGGVGSFTNPISAPVSTTQNFTFSGSKRVNMREEVEIEPLMDILAKVAYNVQQSLVLNPGNSIAFPRLSKIAAEYQEYEVIGLEYIYIPESTTQADGYVIMSPAYNPDQLVPSTKQIAQTNWNASTGAKWTKSTCTLDRKMMHPLGPRKYVDLSEVGIGERQTKDVGRLDVCVGGSSAADEADLKVWGQVFVRYRVRLYGPVIQAITRAPSLYTTGVQARIGAPYTDSEESPVLWQDFSAEGTNIAANALGFKKYNTSILYPGFVGFVCADSALNILGFVTLCMTEIEASSIASSYSNYRIYTRYFNSAVLGPVPDTSNPASGVLNARAEVKFVSVPAVPISTAVNAELVLVFRMSLEKGDTFFVTVNNTLTGGVGAGDQTQMIVGSMQLLSV